MRSKSSRNPVLILGGLFGATLWAAIFILPHINGRAGHIDAFEYLLLDLRYSLAGPDAPSHNVAIVALDDETLAFASSMPGRERLAQVIRSIADSGARALAVDVLLADQGSPDQDALLADALSRLPSVIAAAAVFPSGPAQNASLIWPQPPFSQAAQPGLVNLSTDSSGTPRYAPLLVQVGDTYYPSLALLAASAFSGERAVFDETTLALGDRNIPLDQNFNMALRYAGSAGSVATVSAAGLLDGPMATELSGKLVVLGYTASAMGDRFSTPFDDSTPGVEIIATAISQLIGGATLRRDDTVRAWDAAHAAGLTLLCVLAITALPLSRGGPVVFGLFGLSLLLVTVLFSFGLWMSAALPLVAAGPPVLLAGVLRYSQERQRANRSEKAAASLRRFQSPTLAAKIESDPDYLAEPIEQDLVILFVDLTAFTGLSQRLGPDGTRDLLRLFHKLIARTVEAQGGSVFNYMGDGALAVFGLDEPASGSAADSALEAAFDFVRSLSQQRLAGLPDEQIGCRIGLHSGSTILSRMGADSHQQVTVTGDSVNLASRLMEVAKSQGATVVASQDFAQGLSHRSRNGMARQIDVEIRGRVGGLSVLVWTQQDLVREHIPNNEHPV